jgi:hypothetical protein
MVIGIISSLPFLFRKVQTGEAISITKIANELNLLNLIKTILTYTSIN